MMSNKNVIKLKKISLSDLDVSRNMKIHLLRCETFPLKAQKTKPLSAGNNPGTVGCRSDRESKYILS